MQRDERRKEASTMTYVATPPTTGTPDLSPFVVSPGHRDEQGAGGTNPAPSPGDGRSWSATTEVHDARGPRAGWLGRRLQNLKVGVRLGLLAGIPTLLLVIVGIQGLGAQSSLESNASTLYANGMTPLDSIATVRLDVYDARLAQRKVAVVTAGKQSLTAPVKLVQDAMAAVGPAVDAYTKLLEPGQPGYAAKQAAMADFTVQWSKWTGHTNDLIVAAQHGDFNATLADMNLGTAPGNQALSDLQKVHDLVLAEGKAINAKAVATAAGQRSNTEWFLVLGVLAALALSWLITRSVTRPLRSLGATLRTVAGGDLTARSDIVSTDEIGRVAHDLNDTLAAQQANIGALAASADALTDSAQVLSATSSQLSASASETSGQAAVVSDTSSNVNERVQSVAAATEEFSSSISEITSNATEAAKVASDAVTLGAEASATINKLESSSARIGEVIKLIGEIANRTNLLALNAMIEASRAGDAGRGFAVVATEVKDLAAETAKATDDVNAIVSAIQSDVRAATAAVAEITSINQRIDEFQQTIAAAVEEQTVTTNEIARSVSTAATESAQISDTVAGVVQAASTTATGADGTLHAARDLAQLASDLRARVEQFEY
jgi:methyl-accepting chemotaxis protein